MKMFLWQRVSNATGSCHDEGGIVVLAENLERARELLLSRPAIPKSCQALAVDPDFSCKISGPKIEEDVWVFPDAGCC